MLDLRNIDYAGRLEKWQSSEYFSDIDRRFVHYKFYQMSMEGGEVSEDLIRYIQGQLLNFFRATAESVEQFEKERAEILKMWPVVSAHLQRDKGLAQLMVEHGCWAHFILPFLWDIWHQQALSFLPGFGLARTVTDEIVPLPYSDRLSIFTTDCTFGMEKHRTKVAQKLIKKAKKTLFLGGGIAPALWAWQYPLGELNQEIIIVDSNPAMPKYLEKLIGRPLKEVGITYYVEDVDWAFNNPDLAGWADVVDCAGFASYFDAKADYFYNGMAKLIAPQGVGFFDYTLMDPTFGFVLRTCHWSNVFKVEQSVDEAIKVAENHTALANLQIVDAISGPSNHPVSVAFTVRHAS